MTNNTRVSQFSSVVALSYGLTPTADAARGFMVRYIAENNIQDVEGIRHFDTEGYKLVESKSTDDTIVFDRPKQAAVAAKKKKAPASKEKAAGPKTKKRARSKK